MRSPAPAWIAAVCSLTTALGAAQAQTTFATFDVNQFQANGFRFGDFDDDFFGNFDVSQGVISLDLTEDIDLANGFFGGAGSDVVVDFDETVTQIEVTLQVGPDNVASDFRVTLLDNDGDDSGPGLGTEEFQYLVDISGFSPSDGFVTVALPLNSFIFRQQGFGFANDGDTLTNFGLRQIQVQSAFGVSDRLQVDIESVKLVDPLGEPNPLLIELTPATFAAQPASFDFGTFQDPGVVDQSGDSFVIDTTQSPTPGEGGGLGFSGLNVDFEAFEHAIEIEARLLPGNDATSFNLLMGDVDGDDSGPTLGSDDVIYTVDTAQFNESDFTTVTIPLGTGTESNNVTTFGFTNGGDNIQNFGLSQLQIQVDADNTVDGLAIEIARFSIVNLFAIDGDFNADGVVDAADYTVYRDNFGGDEEVLRGAGDGSGTVDAGDLTVWRDNFGAVKGASAAAVPEPTTVAALLLSAVMVVAHRRHD